MSSRDRLFDLHVHSVQSDGAHSPVELLNLARRTGLAGFAFTDHDVFPSANDWTDLCRQSGLDLITGVEFSCYHEFATTRNDTMMSVNSGSVDPQTCQLPAKMSVGDETPTVKRVGFHLLGYGFDLTHTQLRKLSDQLVDARKVRVQKLIANLQQKGIVLPEGRRRVIDRLRSPGRSHVAQELVRLRVVSSSKMAFASLLHHRRGLDPGFERTTLSHAIDTLHDAGGVAVLAHPPSWISKEQLAELKQLGLDGIECHFPGAEPRRRRELVAFASEVGLLISAGSDYHGHAAHDYLGRFAMTVGKPIGLPTLDLLDRILAHRT